MYAFYVKVGFYIEISNRRSMAYFYLSMHNYSQMYKLSTHYWGGGGEQKGIFFWQKERNYFLVCFGFTVS